MFLSTKSVASENSEDKKSFYSEFQVFSIHNRHEHFVWYKHMSLMAIMPDSNKRQSTNTYLLLHFYCKVKYQYQLWCSKTINGIVILIMILTRQPHANATINSDGEYRLE